MPIYNNKRLSPGIFSNPLSKVKIGRLYCRAVAAVNSSGNVNLLANIPYNIAVFSQFMKQETQIALYRSGERGFLKELDWAYLSLVKKLCCGVSTY